MNIINFKKFSDPDGTLVPFSIKDIIDFKPKRSFYIKNVPMDTERGNHAHYNTKQFLICVQGAILVKLFDGYQTKEYTIIEDQGIFIDRMIWDSQVFLTGKDILLVLCSTEYNRDDYIEDINTFKEIKTNGQYS